MDSRTLATLAAAWVATGCVTTTDVDCTVAGCDQPDTDDTRDTDASLDPIDPDDAPTPRLWADIHNKDGAFLRAWEVSGAGDIASSYTAGVFSVAAAAAEPTSVIITLWADPTTAETWDFGPTPGGIPSGIATATFIDTNYGGEAVSGTLTVSKWQPTTLPSIFIAEGTFTLTAVENPDDPTWGRQLREGGFEGVRVSSTSF